MLSIDCAIAVWELKIGALTNESVIDPNFHPIANEDERLEETRYKLCVTIVVRYNLYELWKPFFDCSNNCDKLWTVPAKTI